LGGKVPEKLFPPISLNKSQKGREEGGKRKQSRKGKEEEKVAEWKKVDSTNRRGRSN